MRSSLNNRESHHRKNKINNKLKQKSNSDDWQIKEMVVCCICSTFVGVGVCNGVGIGVQVAVAVGLGVGVGGGVGVNVDVGVGGNCTEIGSPGGN